jgi:hypothetical protein
VDIVKCGIGGGCFIGGTKVITKNGLKNIERVKIGDEVITHKGHLKRVIGTNKRLETNTIININGISCTPNHQFYVILKTEIDLVNDSNIHKYAKWVSAGDLSEDYVLVKYQK